MVIAAVEKVEKVEAARFDRLALEALLLSVFAQS